jgi:hypothetical protein
MTDNSWSGTIRTDIVDVTEDDINVLDAGPVTTETLCIDRAGSLHLAYEAE